VVETDALKHFERGDQMLEQGRSRTSAGRSITPEDMAGVVAFLCSEDAAMLVGQVIKIDGGFSIVV
jgi:NAD(P)-dependent dehydrogenase (short-subunit alcohol dehydrogenase family)